MSVWRYRLAEDYALESPHLAGISFCSDWLLIDDGRMLIRAGYAWDGCSPKWYVAGRAIGVPDGPIQADGYPQTAWASLVHDALCQFKHLVPVTKRQAVALFDEMLRAANWRWRSVYVAAVDLFGPQRYAGDLKQGGV